MQFEFEWDAYKARTNLDKHGVSFNEGTTVFADPHVLTFLDDTHSVEDSRFITIGTSRNQRILLVVHNERSELPDRIVIRLISCRKATPLERRKYEEGE